MDEFFCCNVNLCDWLLGITAGLVASGITAFATKYFVDRKSKRSLRAKYATPEGIYDSYSYEDDSTNKLKSESNGEIQISYWRDNILRIYAAPVDSPPWKGIIIMETSNLGTVTWENLLQGGGDIEFGIKRLIVRDTRRQGEGKVIYLAGEKEEGYGKEILIENINYKKPE